MIDNLPYSQRLKVKYLYTNVNILHPYLKYFELLCLYFSLSIAEVKWLLSIEETNRAILRYLIVLTGYFVNRHSSYPSTKSEISGGILQRILLQKSNVCCDGL